MQILQNLIFANSFPKLCFIKFGSKLQRLQNSLLIIASLITFIFLQLNSCFFSQQFQNFTKFHTFNFLHKRKNISTLGTTKTMKNLFFFIDHERWTFFRMKRTQALPMRACFCKSHILAHNIHDIKPGFNFFNVVIHYL